MFLNENIKRLRKARGVSLDVMARAAGISKTTAYKIEAGKTSHPTLECLFKIADYFQMSISALIEEKVADVQDERISYIVRKLQMSTSEDVNLVADVTKMLVKYLHLEDCGFNQKVREKARQPKLVNNGKVCQLGSAPVGMFHTVGDQTSVCFKTAGFIENYESKRVKAFDSQGAIFQSGDHRMVQPLKLQTGAQDDKGGDKCDEYTYGGG